MFGVYCINWYKKKTNYVKRRCSWFLACDQTYFSIMDEETASLPKRSLLLLSLIENLFFLRGMKYEQKFKDWIEEKHFLIQLPPPLQCFRLRLQRRISWDSPGGASCFVQREMSFMGYSSMLIDETRISVFFLLFFSHPFKISLLMCRSNTFMMSSFMYVYESI